MPLSLSYPGKVSEEGILALQAAGKLSREALNHEGPHNALYLGDNLPILSLLRESYANRIDLIYIDPPFGTGQNFANRDRELAYSDELVHFEFLEFLRQRLILLRELLSDQGSIYLHIDKKTGHYVKIIMDEVFGQKNHLNDLTRIKCNPKNFDRKAYGNYSDMILFYAKCRDKQIWNEQREALSEQDLEKLFPKTHPEKGRYTTHPLHAPGETQEGDTGLPWKGLMPPKGRHWRYNRKVLDELDEAGLIEWSATGNPRKIVFARDHKGRKLQDVWEFKDKGRAYATYPTEKNHGLLARIIAQSSHPESIVLDAFAGSGGTLITAHKMGRHWLGIDQSEVAQKVIQENLTNAQIPVNVYAYKVAVNC